MSRGGYGFAGGNPASFPCPRCGASGSEPYCLPLTDAHPYPTLLDLHLERGMSGERRHLWRKPRAVKASRSRDATSSDGPPRRRRNSGTGVEPDRHSGLPRSRT